MNSRDLRAAVSVIVNEVMGDQSQDCLFYTERSERCRGENDVVVRWFIHCAPARDERWREVMSDDPNRALDIFRARLTDFHERNWSRP